MTDLSDTRLEDTATWMDGAADRCMPHLPEHAEEYRIGAAAIRQLLAVRAGLRAMEADARGLALRPDVLEEQRHVYMWARQRTLAVLSDAGVPVVAP